MNRIVGRDVETSRIASHGSGLLVVAGDSGIGKSTVLEASMAQMHGRRSPSIALALGHDGALQYALLNQFADACAQVEEPSGRERLITLLKEAGERIARASGREIGRALSKQLIGLIRARFGDAIVDSASRVWGDLSKPVGQDLVGQVSQLSDLDSIRSLCRLADEVVAFTGALTLLIDRGERLTSSDFGLLMELPELLPAEVSVILGHRTASATDAERIRLAVSRGARELVIEPIEDRLVEEWAKDAGLNSFDAKRIVRLAGGYPIFVESAIQHIQQGRELGHLPVEDRFASLTQSAWLGLSFEARKRARVLLGFPDRPPTDLILAVLEIDGSSWRTVEEELVDARLLSGPYGGNRWFHERRRRVLWDSLLTSEERSELADIILTALPASGDDSKFISFFEVTAAAELAPHSLHFKNHPGVPAVLGLGTAQLAMLYSLIELSDHGSDVEDGGPAFIATEAILEEARAFAPRSGDLIADLERLMEASLIYVASNDRASIAALTLPSHEAYVLLLGRHVAEFGHAPTARIASAIFDFAFRPALSAFTFTVYGIGKPSLAKMHGDLKGIPREEYAIGRQPSLLVRAKWGSRDFYLAAEFEREASRDAALRELKSIPSLLWGEPLALKTLHSAPGQPHPDARFLDAAASLAAEAPWRSTFAPSSPRALDPLEAAELRLGIIEHIRSRASAAELVAVDLDEPRVIAVRVHPNGGEMRIEFSSPTPRVMIVEDWDLTFDDPLFGIKALQNLDLPPSAALNHVSESWSRAARRDPVVEVVMDYRERMRSFNRLQCERVVDLLDVDLVSRTVKAAFLAAHAEVRALYDSGLSVLGRRHEPIAWKTYALLLQKKPGEPRFVSDVIAYVRQPSEAPEFVYGVAVENDPKSSPELGALVQEYFGLKVNDDTSSGWTIASHGIARWLGFDPEAVRVTKGSPIE
ncbi:P-loop NTPase family protein [Terrabacter terrigena]|uniref:Orc1-like AAA ATPase domain-containing protein n=1 Tax=Terrabacter terrigena TaxID=574718 RepID=A0ABW3N2R6_9MICO